MLSRHIHALKPDFFLMHCRLRNNHANGISSWWLTLVSVVAIPVALVLTRLYPGCTCLVICSGTIHGHVPTKVLRRWRSLLPADPSVVPQGAGSAVGPVDFLGLLGVIGLTSLS